MSREYIGRNSIGFFDEQCDDVMVVGVGSGNDKRHEEIFKEERAPRKGLWVLTCLHGRNIILQVYMQSLFVSAMPPEMRLRVIPTIVFCMACCSKDRAVDSVSPHNLSTGSELDLL